MEQKVLKIVNEVDEKCRGHCKPSINKIHGVDHLRQVAYLAGRIALSSNICMKTAIVGGYLHDWARQDDGDGNDHAHKSAELAREIILKYWPDIDTESIFDAIYYHADGLVSKDSIAGCIWDADRITLTRLGIMPKPELLSTTIAKRFYNIYVKHSKVFSETQRISSLIIEQISNNGEAFLGIWCGDLSKYLLKHILVLVEKPLGVNLSKLKILSLYDYSGLSKTHDQSTCYQLYDVCQSFANFRFEQVVCPLHDNIGSAVVNKALCCILPYEYPISPKFEDKNVSNEDNSQIIKMDPIIRDYRSRFFERYNKTPKFIHAFPSNIIKISKKKTILVDRQIRRQYELLWKRTKQLESLLTLHKDNATIFQVSKCPTEIA